LDEIIRFALENGFTGAAVTDTRGITVVPEYRKYCEENLCGCYGKNPACPPASGTVEEMRRRFTAFEHALVLQTTVSPDDGELFTNPALAKAQHNRLAGDVISRMEACGITGHLWMSAGPWGRNSCMSAYCVDAQKLADSVNMQCWVNDGRYRFFSVICY